MKKGSVCGSVFIILLTVSLVACGGGSGVNGGGGGGGGGNPPATPTALTATAGNAQVALTWNAASGATSYKVGRSTTSGGPYSNVASPSVANYTDTSAANGTTYYYVVAAANAYGTSANSAEVSAKPAAPVIAVNVTVDVLADRHAISPYIYGTNFPNDTTYVQDSGTTLVRWGGNASTRYNWMNFATNAAADWYFQNRPMCSAPCATSLYSDSAQFITNIKSAGAFPLMTIGMLPWVAKDGSANSYSFSASKYAYSPCKANPFLADDGNGIKAPCNSNPPVYVTNNDPHDANIEFRDDPNPGDPAGTVYRHPWVTGLRNAFGSSACPLAGSLSVATCHFYDMDNESDIWSGTHRDVHPAASGYNELRDTFISEARAVKSWDPQAITFGPVSCCWYFYWNLNSQSDNKSTHANMDFLPWWLNELYWQDQIAGVRSMDAFDVHAYPDADPSQLSLANQRALALSITQDWWNPAFTTPAWFGSNSVTSTQPLDSKPFRIPRMRALLNTIYPGTPLSFTEWNFALAQASPSANGAEGDFSTALADVDAWGILGRENVMFSTRWTAADSANPAYNSLKLYRNYDGNHSTFAAISVAARHDADPALFSVYSATNTSNTLTLMVVNKDPNSAARASFALNGFTPSQVTTFTLSPASPNTIVAGSSQLWSSATPMTFQPYTATLLVITGAASNAPSLLWELNPDTVFVPANGSITLHPKLVSGSGSINLVSSNSDPGITVTASGTVSAAQQGQVSVTAGGTPGFNHFSVTASDGTTQEGWILVGNPAASLAKTGGDNQTGTAGTVLPTKLAVTLSAGQSGGTAGGASVFFTTSAGSLTNVQTGTEKVFTGSRVIAVTNGFGVASVTLTLPATPGAVTVTAEGPYGLGHPVITPFTETAN